MRMNAGLVLVRANHILGQGYTILFQELISSFVSGDKELHAVGLK